LIPILILAAYTRAQTQATKPKKKTISKKVITNDQNPETQPDCRNDGITHGVEMLRDGGNEDGWI
jgi:hypothetical protein